MLFYPMSLPYLWGPSTKIPEPQMDPKLSVRNSEHILVLSYSQDLKKIVSGVAALIPIGKHCNIYKNNLLLIGH